MTALLAVDNIAKRFGGIRAVDGLSFEVPEGHITALIGPNGAGKTTIFNLITRFLPADTGSIRLHGRDLGRRTPDAVARMGIARSFQDIRLFGRLPVIDNVMIAFPGQSGENPLVAIFMPWRVRRQERENRAKALDILRFVGLDHKAEVLADELSYGQQKLLLIGRLMALEPAVLLLDEPCSGLDPTMLERVMGLLRRLSGEGRTILLIEHNMDVVRALADRVVFLSEGRALADGPTEAILADRDLTKIYFGL